MRMRVFRHGRGSTAAAAWLLTVGLCAFVATKLWPLLLLGLFTFYCARWYLLRQEKIDKSWSELREAETLRQLIAAAEPASPADAFGTCPNCGTADVHLVTEVRGSVATRNCAHCLKDWTVDHSVAVDR